MKLNRRGLMLALSSPSGAGKTTLSRMLLAEDNNITMSVSATTRSPRPGEVDGNDYYFVGKEQFAEMVTTDAFLEHATVFSNSYGTPRDPVNEALGEGRDVLFDIDWQGVQQVKQAADQDIATVFILPPSLPELENRLMKRAQDSAEVIQERMSKATSEMTHWAEYDYVLVNDNLEETFEKLQAILVAEREKRRRQVGMSAFVKTFTDAY